MTDHIATAEELVRRRLSEALGGRRGMFEAGAPTLVFTIAWIASEDLKLSLTLAIAVAVVLLVIRVVQRGQVQFVLNALFVIAIAAVVASRTGEARDVFLPGILINAGSAALLVVSIVVRWPLVGFMIGAASGDPTEWHRDTAVVKLCSQLTAVMAVPLILRASILGALYVANEVALLGAVKLALGWPLLVAALAVMAWLLARNHTPLEQR